MVMVAGQLVRATSATGLDTAGKMTTVGAVSSYTAPTVTLTGVTATDTSAMNSAIATLNTNLNLVGTQLNALLTAIAGINAM